MLQGFKLIYFEVIGNYHNVGNFFKRLEKDLNAAGLTSSEMTITGIYFDDPTSLQDGSHARCAVGAKLETQEAVQKALEFVKRAPKYKFIELPTVP